MNKLAPLLLAFACFSVQAQTSVRVRGTITALSGDVLSVKSRDGKDLKVHLTSDAQVAVARKLALADIKPGTYVGVTSLEQGGKLVAKEVHLIPPQAPAGHMKWDLMPGSLMTNANLGAVVKSGGGSEITLKYKDGEQKILVPAGTPIVGFDNGDRSALKRGETIWTNARVEADGKLVTQRIQVSKGGVKPEH
jgi:uncharacterized protein DUF5666